VGLTNAAGTLVERYTYSAYGTLGIYAANGTVRSSSTYANRHTYTGREYDADLRLYHFRARWYDPATGGFMTRDPLGYVDGMSLYRGYFGVRGMDPSGLVRVRCRCTCGKKGISSSTWGGPSLEDVWESFECTGKATECCMANCDSLSSNCRSCWYSNKWEVEDAIPSFDGCNLSYFDYLLAVKNPTPCDAWLHNCKWASFGVAGTCFTGAIGVKVWVVCGGPTMSFALTPHVTQQTCNVSFQVCGGAWLRGAPNGVVRLESTFKPGFWCLKGVPILKPEGVVLLARAGKPVLIPKLSCLSAAIEAFLRGLRCF
jgi:RHS repeat-associated protein